MASVKDSSLLKDELDKASMEQLHKAVLQLSANCFEVKKLCATILVAAGTLISTFVNKTLDPALFFGGLVVVLIFWMVDAQSYYYQEKLRAHMKRLAEELVARSDPKIEVKGIGMPLSDRRENFGSFRRALHAAFNASMFFYAAVAAMLILLLVLSDESVIRAIPATSNSLK